MQSKKGWHFVYSLLTNCAVCELLIITDDSYWCSAAFYEKYFTNNYRNMLIDVFDEKHFTNNYSDTLMCCCILWTFYW